MGLDPDDTGEAKQSDNVLTYWGVKDIESEYERLLSLGATEHEKTKDVGGDISTATVRDPRGNVIGLIRKRV